MGQYANPLEYPRLPQGDFQFTPAVKCFAPETDPLVLQAAINAWVQTVIAIPDIRWHMTSVHYTSAQKSNNVIHYSALVGYDIIETI